MLVALALAVLAVGLVSCCAELLELDLSTKTWQLTNSNQSVIVPTTLPAHVLGVLAAAGVVQEDPLYRFGELETRWVSEDTWNFTLIWSGQQHQQLTSCKHVMLVLHGVDTFGDVILNGRHMLKANNVHRSWYVPLPDGILRDGANMLSIILQPAVATALRAKVLNKYTIPTMAVPGGFDVYNFARKPASDFGWDWGPAFAPAGITGAVQLVGFDRATLIGALVHQQLVDDSTFVLHVTAQLLVPAGGDSGNLTVQLPELDIQQAKEVSLKARTVAGSQLQALAHMDITIPANRVKLWQPRGLLDPGSKPAMYKVVVTFRPAAPIHGEAVDSTAGAAAAAEAGSSSTVTKRIGFRSVELVRVPIKQAAKELIPVPPSSSSSSGLGSQQPAAAATAASAAAQPHTWAQIQGLWRYVANVTDRPTWWWPPELPSRDWPPPVSSQTKVVTKVLQTQCNMSSNAAARSVGNAAADGTGDLLDHKQQQQQCEDRAAAVAAAAGSSPTQQQQQPPPQEDGESFYFRVNGVPIYAKGANLIPLHILSSAVTADNVVLLLQSAAAANMNMIRIWGGGLYQIDALYAAADELGLLIWQEAMFACSPYPRDPAFLSNVEAEITQQILRLGSHPSIVLRGGSNEIEASLEWYNETRSNLAMYAVDYDVLFEQTIGKVVQQMLPGMPWVDSSPSNGYITLKDDDGSQSTAYTSANPAAAAASVGDPAAANAGEITTGGSSAAAAVIKRWGNSQNPKYGDVHFYNYKDDCQDWRVYPAGRFISEYGWQSYPSWATYSAATAPADWTLAAEMTEYRQRHPNGTVELLAQLARRFKLPDSWQDILKQYQQQHKQQQQQQSGSHDLTCLDASNTSDLWRAFCVKVLHTLLHLWRTATRYASRLFRWTAAAAIPTSSSSSSNGVKDSDSHNNSYNKIQHWIYLTQLQQMLCYDTALSYWRRLRSSPDVLTMGVLYWQLNDIWAGASWSSIDYGGVWKPLHYQVARSFADLALSVQHDLHNDTLQVHVVSDLQRTVEAQLTIRMLSLSDTVDSCSLSNAGSSTDTTAEVRSQQSGRTLQHSQHQQQHLITKDSIKAAAGPAAAACKDTWSKLCQTVILHIPPRSSVQGFSGSIRLLLAAAPGCSSSSCYVHIALESADQPPQEATVWLAAFSDLGLQSPRLQISGFEPVGASDPGSNPTPSNTVSPGRDADIEEGTEPGAEVQFTVKSDRVAVYSVLELQDGYNMPGHFSDNAFTVHPCEPRQVRYIPQLGAGTWHDYLVRIIKQHQQRNAEDISGKADKAVDCDITSKGVETGGVLLLEMLQQQLAVSSLYDHQQFGPDPS